MDLAQFYSRQDIQKRIIEIAKNREMAVKFGDRGFGKRPDVLMFEGDIGELVKQGATSFHISEERWKEPLELRAGMNKKQLDELRTGWDLIIDIDSKNIEHSKIMAEVLIEALKFHNINKPSVKFSGNKGFHIGISFDSFPDKVNETETKILFPEGPKIIASYLKEMIKDMLSTKILENKTIEELKKEFGNKIIRRGEFNPFNIVDVDSALISNRHMFRAPYSYHEKSGLISVPIENLKRFDVKTAMPENVKADMGFLQKGEDASQLLIQAFDWNSKNRKEDIREEKKREFSLPEKAIEEKYFPSCILLGLKGLEDGKKRFLFLLINFLRNMGWTDENIKKRVGEWNRKNKEPLRENYITSQINWHTRQKQRLLPPNCENAAYYLDIRICRKDGLCMRVKNPVNYALRKRRFKN